MPAKSAKQLRFMRAISHDAKFAAKVGVSQSVGREFSEGPSMGNAPLVGSTIPRPAPSSAPLTLPGGAVHRGGYFANTKFGMPSMPGLRKVR